MLRKKGKVKFCRLVAWCLALLMVFPLCSSVGTSQVYAAALGEVSYYEKVTYDGMSNGKFQITIDSGTYDAYCGDHNKTTPEKGRKITDITETTNVKVKKILYYGYGGPGAIVAKNNKGWTYTEQAVSYAMGNGSARREFSNWAEEVYELPAPPASFRAYICDVSGSGYQPLVYWDYAPEGYVEVNKISANTSVTNGNANYSLEGAVYSIYSGNTVVDMITTDKNGYGISGALEEGNYTVKESKASKGYEIDVTAHKVTVVGDTTQKVTSKEVPKFGAIELYKKSADADVTDGNENYSLAGAQYGVYSGSKLVTTLITDASGYARVDKLPLGHYTVKEISASPGYDVDVNTYEVTIDDAVTKTVNSNENPSNGGIELYKVFANPEITDGNTCYSLAGAEYGVYSKDVLITTMITDEKGYASVENLPLGNYVVKEMVASPGFAVDTNSYNVTVTTDKNAVVNSKEVPLNDPAAIELFKIDSETGDTTTQGKASLAGAEFTICHYPTTEYNTIEELENAGIQPRTWVLTTKEIKDSKGNIRYAVILADSFKIVGDEFYKDSSGATILPLGTVTVKETKAPEGYTLTDGFIQACDENGNPTGEKTNGAYMAKVLEENDLAKLVGGNHFLVGNQVKRGDFEMRKIDADTQKAMVGIQFKLTSNTTGESHHFTTGENGYFSSASSYCKHGTNTNGGNVGDGMWFGFDADGNPVPVDENKGALPYDSYTIEEIRSELNVGKKLFKDTIIISKNNTVVDLNNIENISIAISTTAKDEVTNSHYAFAEETACIIDTVAYSGVTPGEEYTLKGKLMDKNTKEPVKKADGSIVEKSITFVPTSTTGLKDVEFTFDASYLAGHDVVVFESLYEGDELMAVHENWDDEDQTIHFPGIQTSATDSETKEHLANPDDEVTITDVVTYTNLVSGKTYTVNGTLVDKETGNPVIGENGTPVTAEQTFTTTESNGTVELTFTFNGTELAGKTVVVFETLTYKGKEYAVHADINDEAQTIHFPAVGTTAVGSDSGNKLIAAEEKVSITDTVSYSNLLPSKEYTLIGTLMDRQTGSPVVDAHGLQVENTITFTPESSDGSVDMEFVFDGSQLSAGGYVVFETLVYDETIVAEHKDIEDEGQTVYVPTIGTNLTDMETETKNANADDMVTLVDRVEYKNLVPGEQYTLSGILMDKDKEKPVKDTEGNEITSTVTFVAETRDGYVDVVFAFDGTDLEGTTIVAFESLQYKEKEYAVHADIEDVAQTIWFPEIKTSATDTIDGDQEVKKNESITVTDHVEYMNLIPGQTYVVEGVLMDKATELPLTINGNTITSSASFVPESADGSIDVVFTFDGSDYQGEDIVVFEKLYLTKTDAEGNVEKDLVASHEDINDGWQTLHLFEEIIEIIEDSPKTGDSLLILVLAGCVIAGGTILIKRSKKKVA